MYLFVSKCVSLSNLVLKTSLNASTDRKKVPLLKSLGNKWAGTGKLSKNIAASPSIVNNRPYDKQNTKKNLRV